MLQNRALRFIDFSPPGTTILPIYRQFNVLPLNKLIDLARANYMYSFSNNQLPIAFRSYCSRPEHRYETRFSKHNFSRPLFRSKLSETSIKVIGPKIWTSIPPEAKILPFRKTFSKRMKSLYLDELPSVKRTKPLIFKDSKFKELKAIFDETGDDTTFYGFENTISALFLDSGSDSTFFGFENSIDLETLFEDSHIESTFIGFPMRDMPV